MQSSVLSSQETPELNQEAFENLSKPRNRGRVPNRKNRKLGRNNILQNIQVSRTKLAEARAFLEQRLTQRYERWQAMDEEERAYERKYWLRSFMYWHQPDPDDLPVPGSPEMAQYLDNHQRVRHAQEELTLWEGRLAELEGRS